MSAMFRVSYSIAPKGRAKTPFPKINSGSYSFTADGGIDGSMIVASADAKSMKAADIKASNRKAADKLRAKIVKLGIPKSAILITGIACVG